jgi:hypothetical protein
MQFINLSRAHLFGGVISSRIASSATRALNSGEWFFRFFILDHFFHHAIHLNNWSEFPRPPLYEKRHEQKPDAS